MKILQVFAWHILEYGVKNAKASKWHNSIESWKEKENKTLIHCLAQCWPANGSIFKIQTTK